MKKDIGSIVISSLYYALRTITFWVLSLIIILLTFYSIEYVDNYLISRYDAPIAPSSPNIGYFLEDLCIPRKHKPNILNSKTIKNSSRKSNTTDLSYENYSEYYRVEKQVVPLSRGYYEYIPCTYSEYIRNKNDYDNGIKEYKEAYSKYEKNYEDYKIEHDDYERKRNLYFLYSTYDIDIYLCVLLIIINILISPSIEKYIRDRIPKG